MTKQRRKIDDEFEMNAFIVKYWKHDVLAWQKKDHKNAVLTQKVWETLWKGDNDYRYCAGEL